MDAIGTRLVFLERRTAAKTVSAGAAVVITTLAVLFLSESGIYATYVATDYWEKGEIESSLYVCSRSQR